MTRAVPSLALAAAVLSCSGDAHQPLATSHQRLTEPSLSLLRVGGDPGRTLVVEVRASGVPDLRGFDVILRTNPDVLRPVSVAPAGILDDIPHVVARLQALANGKVRAAVALAGGNSLSLPAEGEALFTATFELVGWVGTTAPVVVEKSIFVQFSGGNAAALDHQVAGGALDPGCQTITGIEAIDQQAACVQADAFDDLDPSTVNNHGLYVSRVAHAAKALHAAGEITQEQSEQVVEKAAESQVNR